jgi:hypothetical protein
VAVGALPSGDPLEMAGDLSVCFQGASSGVLRAAAAFRDVKASAGQQGQAEALQSLARELEQTFGFELGGGVLRAYFDPVEGAEGVTSITRLERLEVELSPETALRGRYQLELTRRAARPGAERLSELDALTRRGVAEPAPALPRGTLDEREPRDASCRRC